MTAQRQLKLGFILHGGGPGWGDWRHPDAQPNASTNFQFYKRQAQVAEAGKFGAEVLAPLNRGGDTEGARLENGVVTTFH